MGRRRRENSLCQELGGGREGGKAGGREAMVGLRTGKYDSHRSSEDGPFISLINRDFFFDINVDIKTCNLEEKFKFHDDC